MSSPTHADSQPLPVSSIPGLSFLHPPANRCSWFTFHVLKMRWPRGQSAHLHRTPAHPRLQRAELSEAAGGVVRQVGGGPHGGRGLPPRRGASNPGWSSARRAPTRSEKRPRCRAWGHGLNSPTCSSREGTKGPGQWVSLPSGHESKHNLEKGGRQEDAALPRSSLQGRSGLAHHSARSSLQGPPLAASSGLMQVLPRWAERRMISGWQGRGAGRVASRWASPSGDGTQDLGRKQSNKELSRLKRSEQAELLRN